MIVLRSLLQVVSVIAAVADPDSGPNLTEWQASKEADAATVSSEKARIKKMAAIDKAKQLLENLRVKVLAEGEAEAATYNEFSCFCKDTTRDKLASISNGENEKGSLVANLGVLAGRRDGLDVSIQGNLDFIEATETRMAESRATRKKDLKLYETNTADLMAALEALDGAIHKLKASVKPSMAQMQSISGTVRTAALLADALGLGSPSTKKVVSLLLQQPANEVQMEDYKYHSDDIISTLEGLRTDFQQEKTSVDEAEVSSVKSHELYMQGQTHAKKMANHELDQNRKSRSSTIEEIAMDSQRLSTVETTLMEDKEYSTKLSHMCSDKAKTWDQRTNARADELSTLTSAIQIIQGAVEGNTSAKTIRFAQQGMSVRLAKAVAIDEGSMDAIESEAEDADAPPSLFQQDTERRGMLRATVKRHPAATDGREFIAELLASEGKHLKSSMLTSLASRLSSDPFAKVKQLIQELIERLLQQATDEANHKGWCDKATSDASQKRDYAAEEVASLNVEMARLEANRDQLEEELAALGKDITELIDTRNEATRVRGEESRENTATVEEATEGLHALELCIDLLAKDYKVLNKGKVDLSLAQGPMDDAPETFAIGNAYRGAQSEAGGILGMLDVMKSDFIRTVKETQIAEAQAEQDHLEFMTETGKSLSQKQEAKTQKDTQHGLVVGKLFDADQIFGQQNAILVGSIAELIELKAACIDTGMSYSDRVARRQDEIASLNKALCILGRYEQYGPGGAADGC